MPPKLSEANEQMAKYVAMVVRNALEDFHCEHLTDEQMKQLNPLIRNAIATALHAFDHYERSAAAHEFVDYHFRSIPKYWEQPEMLEGYVKMWLRRGESS
jgi:hypothetical protein